MLTWDATAEARAAGNVYGACWLADFNFLSGLQRVTSWSEDLTTSTALAYTRLGAGFQVQRLSESADTDAAKLVFSLSVADSAKLALAVGNAAEYRGRKVELYLQLLDEKYTCAGAPLRRWFGYMDNTSIERRQPNPNQPGTQGLGGTIKITCSRAGLSRSRRYEGLRINHEQQQIDYAGDNGYEYIPKLIEKPTEWLSKRFQEI